MKLELFPKDQIERTWNEEVKLFSQKEKELPQCMRCGGRMDAHLPVNALSRYVDVYICEKCGVDEALRDAAHAPLPLTDWEVVKSGRVAKEKDSCYLVLNCTFDDIFKDTVKRPMRIMARPVGEIVYSRSDYDGSRWWTTWHDQREKKTSQALIREIDEFQKTLFTLPAFKTLDTLRHFCRYAQPTSEPTEYNLFSETQNLNIWIRIITRSQDYNLYVHYYEK